jgi:hypothetical protein
LTPRGADPQSSTGGYVHPQHRALSHPRIEIDAEPGVCRPKGDSPHPGGPILHPVPVPVHDHHNRPIRPRNGNVQGAVLLVLEAHNEGASDGDRNRHGRDQPSAAPRTRPPVRDPEPVREAAVGDASQRGRERTGSNTRRFAPTRIGAIARTDRGRRRSTASLRRDRATDPALSATGSKSEEQCHRGRTGVSHGCNTNRWTHRGTASFQRAPTGRPETGQSYR